MTTGHAKTLIIHMSMPGMEMTKLKIDLKSLNVFVGYNGVGKSLVMKLTWVLNMVAQLVVAKVPGIEQGAQFILDNSIPDHDMMAVLIMEFDSGAIISMKLLEGKIQGVEYTGFEKIDKPSRPIYMSAGMRTFSAIKQYLSLRKTLKQEEMVKHYKLYDVMYIEGLIARMPMTLDKSTINTLHGFGVEDLSSIVYENDDFVGVFKGQKQSLTMLGSGHQALINMTIGALS